MLTPHTRSRVLQISPFTYGLVIRQVYDSGAVFENDMLDITDDVLFKHFSAGVANVAAISLAIGFPNKASAPHLVINAYKNLLAVALATEISFKGVDKVNNVLFTLSLSLFLFPRGVGYFPKKKKKGPEEEFSVKQKL